MADIVQDLKKNTHSAKLKGMDKIFKIKKKKDGRNSRW